MEVKYTDSKSTIWKEVKRLREALDGKSNDIATSTKTVVVSDKQNVDTFWENSKKTLLKKNEIKEDLQGSKDELSLKIKNTFNVETLDILTNIKNVKDKLENGTSEIEKTKEKNNLELTALKEDNLKKVTKAKETLDKLIKDTDRETERKLNKLVMGYNVKIENNEKTREDELTKLEREYNEKTLTYKETIKVREEKLEKSIEEFENIKEKALDLKQNFKEVVKNKVNSATHEVMVKYNDELNQLNTTHNADLNILRIQEEEENDKVKELESKLHNITESKENTIKEIARLTTANISANDSTKAFKALQEIAMKK